MQLVQTQGLVLRTIDYKESQRILTVFTEKSGLISLIVKGLGKKRSDLLLLTSPLSVAEFHYVSGRGDLYQLKDASLLKAHLDLRSDLAHLQAAVEICQALLKTQLPGKPATALYQLTLSYFKRIPLFREPEVLVTSFLLKLFKHEGVLLATNRCMVCEAKATHLSKGEPACPAHAGPISVELNEEEWEQFFVLLEAREFAELETLRLKAPFLAKMERMLQSL